MHIMASNFKDLLANTKKEISLWAYAAWTLPFVALAAVIMESIFGFETSIGITVVVISITFIAVSVFWWWWALRKIFLITSAMKSNEDGFAEVISELRQTRVLVREHLDKKD